MQSKKVVLIPGDGIGPEVCKALCLVFEEAQVPIEWVESQAGLSVVEHCPSGLPDETLDLIRQHRLALKGPTTTPVGSGHQSVNVQIRKSLGLFANVRPARTIPSIKSRYSDIDLITVRENIEDTYSGMEHMQSPGVAQGLKIISQVGAERSIRFAFELAQRQKRKQVCCVHKANIHKLSDGLFLECFNRIKSDYPEIQARDLMVDNLAMQLVTNPDPYDVLVMSNLYGDIISDLCAGLVGGLGVAPAANIGNDLAVFEAVHGSAPDIAGKGIANPTAVLLSGTFLLRHIGLASYADYIYSGIVRSLSAKKMTADLGGSLSTMQFAESIASSFDPELKPDPSSIEIAPSAVKSNGWHLDGSSSSCELVGADVFVRSSKFPAPPKQVGSLELDCIFNRGTKVAQEKEGFDLVDVYCLRYRSKNPSNDEIINLLQKLSSEQLEWVHCEKLFVIDGRDGFTG